MKDLFMEAHEELAAEMLERHPFMDEAKAYDITADAALDRMIDRIADMTDRARMEAKDRGL